MPLLELWQAGGYALSDYAAMDLLRLFFGPGEVLQPGRLCRAGGDAPRLRCGFRLAAEAGEDEASSPGALEAFCELTDASGRAASPVCALPLARGEERKLAARRAKRCLYHCLSRLTGVSFPWGSLTGIRPAYLVHEARAQGRDEAETLRMLREDYAVSAEKAALIWRVAEGERRLIAELEGEKTLLYVHVPFCRTRCAYCSFTLREAIDPSEAELEDYLRALIEELRLVCAALSPAPSALYFGGGTPSLFSARQLGLLFRALEQVLDRRALREICVEAGRADSLDAEKLRLMRAFGVTRLCINPQSMNEKTLRRIRRPESPTAVADCVRSARALGFDNINMDLIAGLPGEDLRDFAHSLRRVLDLGAESVTVHSLARKRSSDLDRALRAAAAAAQGARFGQGEGREVRSAAQELQARLGRGDEETAAMLSLADRLLGAAGYRAYYLYRQKDGVGGLENVGYAKPGKACLYNVGMMGDVCSVIACGAGAISKRVRGRQVARLENKRDPALYAASPRAAAAAKRDFFGPG